MKDIILKFKTQEDYNDFIEGMREDNKTINFFTENETDNSITIEFEDSQLITN